MTARCPVLASFALSVVVGCQSAGTSPLDSEPGPRAGGQPFPADDDVRSAAVVSVEEGAVVRVDAGSTDASSRETGAAASAEDSAKEAPPLDEDCEAMLARLRGLREGIPIVFVGLDRSYEEIDRDIQESIRLGERFLEKCGEGEEAPWVLANLGRGYLARRGRYMGAYKESLERELVKTGLSEKEIKNEREALLEDAEKEYLARIRRLGETALERAERGSEERYMALALLADVCQQEGKHEQRIARARQVLEEYPDAPHRSKFLIDVGLAMTAAGRYADAAEWMKPACEKHPQDMEYYFYNSILFDALTGIGDLEGMERLVRKMREEYPRRMEEIDEQVGGDLPAALKHARGQYEQWYDLSKYWLGYIRYALGDTEGAKNLLRQAKSYLEAKAAERSLPSVQRIYLDFRVKDLLRFIEEHHGKEPFAIEYCTDRVDAVDFSENIHWVTEKRFTLGEVKGKIVPILLRLPGVARSMSFYARFAELGQEMEEKGVQAMNLAFFPSRVDEEKIRVRVERMRAEREAFGVTIPAGYDTSAGQCLYRSFYGKVGPSPVVVVLDGEGRFAWYLPDPRDLDKEVFARVLERMVKEPGSRE